jgi:hypothetical protein
VPVEASVEVDELRTGAHDGAAAPRTNGVHAADVDDHAVPDRRVAAVAVPAAAGDDVDPVPARPADDALDVRRRLAIGDRARMDGRERRVERQPAGGIAGGTWCDDPPFQLAGERAQLLRRWGVRSGPNDGGDGGARGRRRRGGRCLLLGRAERATRQRSAGAGHQRGLGGTLE